MQQISKHLRKTARGLYDVIVEDVADDVSDSLIKAARKIDNLEVALKVIYIWADTPGALHPVHVRDLCAKALGIDDC